MSTRYERDVERQRKLIRAKKMLDEIRRHNAYTPVAEAYTELIEERVSKNESSIPGLRELDDADIDDNLRSVEVEWEEAMIESCPDNMEPDDFIRRLKAKREAERLE